MGFFTSTKPAPVVTPSASGLAEQLSVQLDSNALRLEKHKDKALSSFRRTVHDLRHVNAALQADVALADQLMETLTARKSEALTAIADNDKVCEGIIAIIGEVPDTACDETCEEDG